MAALEGSGEFVGHVRSVGLLFVFGLFLDVLSISKDALRTEDTCAVALLIVAMPCLALSCLALPYLRRMATRGRHTQGQSPNRAEDCSQQKNNDLVIESLKANIILSQEYCYLIVRWCPSITSALASSCFRFSLGSIFCKSLTVSRRLYAFWK